MNTVFNIFFSGLECDGHSFAYAVHFVFLRDVWIRTQRAAVVSRHSTDLANHIPSPISLLNDFKILCPYVLFCMYLPCCVFFLTINCSVLFLIIFRARIRDQVQNKHLKELILIRITILLLMHRRKSIIIQY